MPPHGLGGWATPRAGDRATRLTPDRLAAGDSGAAMDLADALAHVRKPVSASTLAGSDVEAMGPDAIPSSVNLPPTSRSLSPVANDADMEAAMLATRSQDLPSAGLKFSLPALDEVLPGEDQKLRATFQPVETDVEMHAPATALPRLDVRTMTSFDKLKPLSRIIGGYRNWREQLVDLMDVIAMPTLLHIVGRQADDGSVFEFGADAYKTRALGRLYDARLYTLVNAAYDGPAADTARQTARKYNPKSGHAFVEHLDFVRGRPTQARLLALEMKVYDLRLDRAGNVQRYINAARALRTTLISYRVSPNDPIVLTRLYHQWAMFYQRLTQPSARHMSIHRALRQIAKMTTTADFDTFATRYEKFALTAGLTDEPATAQRPTVAPRPAVAVNVVSGTDGIPDDVLRLLCKHCVRRGFVRMWANGPINDRRLRTIARAPPTPPGATNKTCLRAAPQCTSIRRRQLRRRTLLRTKRMADAAGRGSGEGGGLR